jgi:hypothetical protein
MGIMIKLEKLNKSYSVLTETNVEIGSFQLDSDGFYYLWFKDDMTGCWTSHSLRLIADKLDEVNKPFDDNVKEYFDQERRDREERARVEYRKLLNESGMFFEFYPHLTGEWKKDKLEWFVIHADLEDLRAKNKTF